MSSSETMDSGRFSGGHKSNFSHTCTLLSRYLKENGSFGDLSLGLSPNFQPHGSSTAGSSKNLPTINEKAGQQGRFENRRVTSEDVERERAPLTIFYGGQVMLFSDFPADKAKEIMDMAIAVNNGAGMVQKPAESGANLVNGPNNLMPQSGHTLTPMNLPLVTDLPIARRASLARFLEKRKYRLTARSPYQIRNTPADSSAEDGESDAWLGLAAQSLAMQE